MIDENLIQEKISEIDKVLEVEMESDPDDPSLSKQLTLGDNWDDPYLLLNSMDEQPIRYAQWAYLLKQARVNLEMVSSKLKTWISIKKGEIEVDIYDENIENGKTPNNASPTQSSIQARFDAIYNETDEKGNYVDDEYRLLVRDLGKAQENHDKIEIVKKAFEQRKDLLISMASLLKGMMDNNLYVKKKMHKALKDDNEEIYSEDEL